MDQLSAADRASVDGLSRQYRGAPPTAAPDAFRYKISRGAGADAEAVEVPEGALPHALASAVQDELL